MQFILSEPCAGAIAPDIKSVQKWKFVYSTHNSFLLKLRLCRIRRFHFIRLKVVWSGLQQPCWRNLDNLSHILLGRVDELKVKHPFRPVAKEDARRMNVHDLVVLDGPIAVPRPLQASGIRKEPSDKCLHNEHDVMQNAVNLANGSLISGRLQLNLHSL